MKCDHVQGSIAARATPAEKSMEYQYTSVLLLTAPDSTAKPRTSLQKAGLL